MYRLGELSDARRKLIGSGMLIAGVLGLVLGVIWIHWSSIPLTETVDGVEMPVVVDYLNWWPRGRFWKGFGYLIVLGATTIALVGATFLWVLNQKMTWARATVAGMLAWLALVFFFGMVPSEWLNYAQTDLDWSPQKIALTLPSWLVLGNDITISFAALKDAISAGYNTGLLVAAPVFALMIQKMKDGRPVSAAAEEPSGPAVEDNAGEQKRGFWSRVVGVFRGGPSRDRGPSRPGGR